MVDELQYGVGGGAALCFPQSAIEVYCDATCVWTTTAAGGALVRFRQRVSLTQPGARVDLAGVSAIAGHRQLHNWVRVDHLTGHTGSGQSYRVVADGASRASFDGRVGIARHADGANAEQLSKNLLLSRTARIDARPQLDILDDDVKASHGATIEPIRTSSSTSAPAASTRARRARCWCAASSPRWWRCTPIRRRGRAPRRSWPTRADSAAMVHTVKRSGR